MSVISDLTAKVIEQIRNETAILREERLAVELATQKAERVASELRELISTAGIQTETIRSLSDVQTGSDLPSKISRQLREGKTIQEIATELDIPVATARLLSNIGSNRKEGL